MRRSAYADTRVTVLGAAGFIGRWVAKALSERGAVLQLVGRDAVRTEAIRRAWRIEGTVVAADITTPGAVRDLIAHWRPSVVFNLAAYGVDPNERDPAMAAVVNTELPGLLAELLAAHGDPEWPGQQVVHAGSALEYGTAAGDLRETTVATPTTTYGRTKLDGTQLLVAAAERQGVRATTGRLFTVYGPGEREGRLLPSLLAAAATREPISLTAGEQRRDFTYVADAAEGLLRIGLAETEALGPVNIATSQLTAVREFVETAAHAFGIASDRLSFGAIPTRAEEMHHDPVNVERLRSVTRWMPSTSIVEGLGLMSPLLHRPFPVG